MSLLPASGADTVAVKDLPPLVAAAILKTLPDAKVVSATSEALNDYVYFNVRVMEADKVHLVRINENGLIESVKEVRK